MAPATRHGAPLLQGEGRPGRCRCRHPGCWACGGRGGEGGIGARWRRRGRQGWGGVGASSGCGGRRCEGGRQRAPVGAALGEGPACCFEGGPCIACMVGVPCCVRHEGLPARRDRWAGRGCVGEPSITGRPSRPHRPHPPPGCLMQLPPAALVPSLPLSLHHLFWVTTGSAASRGFSGLAAPPRRPSPPRMQPASSPTRPTRSPAPPLPSRAEHDNCRIRTCALSDCGLGPPTQRLGPLGHVVSSAHSTPATGRSFVQRAPERMSAHEFPGRARPGEQPQLCQVPTPAC